jgi:hypothetical protein
VNDAKITDLHKLRMCSRNALEEIDTYVAFCTVNGVGGLKAGTQGVPLVNISYSSFQETVKLCTFPPEPLVPFYFIWIGLNYQSRASEAAKCPMPRMSCSW